MTEAFYGTGSAIGTGGDAHGGYSAFINLDASRSSSIYGNSNTVQPPAIILLPCIKAFDTVLNVTEINAHGLASEVSVKANRADIEPYLSKAWVNFDASAGIVKIKNSRNIQGVVHVEKGVYDVIDVYKRQPQCRPHQIGFRPCRCSRQGTDRYGRRQTDGYFAYR